MLLYLPHTPIMMNSNVDKCFYIYHIHQSRLQCCQMLLYWPQTSINFYFRVAKCCYIYHTHQSRLTLMLPNASIFTTYTNQDWLQCCQMLLYWPQISINFYFRVAKCCYIYCTPIKINSNVDKCFYIYHTHQSRLTTMLPNVTIFTAHTNQD